MTIGRDDHLVVVVGAGLAAWRLIEELRRLGYRGSITVLGDEFHPPYDRPPLSKQILSGKWGLAQTLLATDQRLEAADVKMKLGLAAVALDVDALAVTLADGSVVEGSHVVIATGVRARRLDFSARGLHYVRTWDDVRRLRRDVEVLREGDTVCVIGGGFIGAEAATSLKARGLSPTILEAAPRPLQGVLGDPVARWLEGLAGDAGIDLKVNQVITDVRNEGGRVLVRRDGERDLRCGCVVAGVGALANTEWLSDSGLTLDNGVVVDDNLSAAAHVSAIGDVARFSWSGPLGVRAVRIEHWQVASDHGARLAHFLMTGESSTTPLVPYFWSDQYGKKLQLLGHPQVGDEVRMVRGDPSEGKWLALYHRDDVVTGVVALSQPRALMLTRPVVERPTGLAEAIAAAPWEG